MLDAGKSTLIKMLIQLHEQSENPNDLSFPSPIVGVPQLDRHNSNHGNTHIPMEYIPTSADVHLYADPVRFDKRTPLLYADCEGLEGGENLPVGAPENRTTLLNTESTIARLTPGRLRRLVWADAEKKKRTRGFFVRQMYPRILYALSDVVVFVVPDANSKYEFRKHQAARSVYANLRQDFRGHYITSPTVMGRGMFRDVSQPTYTTTCHNRVKWHRS
jgi:hypothetical protein